MFSLQFYSWYLIGMPQKLRIDNSLPKGHSHLNVGDVTIAE